MQGSFRDLTSGTYATQLEFESETSVTAAANEGLSPRSAPFTPNDFNQVANTFSFGKVFGVTGNVTWRAKLWPL